MTVITQHKNGIPGMLSFFLLAFILLYLTGTLGDPIFLVGSVMCLLAAGYHYREHSRYRVQERTHARTRTQAQAFEHAHMYMEASREYQSMGDWENSSRVLVMNINQLINAQEQQKLQMAPNHKDIELGYQTRMNEMQMEHERALEHERSQLRMVAQHAENISRAGRFDDAAPIYEAMGLWDEAGNVRKKKAELYNLAPRVMARDIDLSTINQVHDNFLNRSSMMEPSEKEVEDDRDSIGYW